MPSPEGAHNWHPMSFNPTTGLVYLGVLNDTAVHAVTSDFKINLHDQTTGADRAYIGPVRDQWLKMISTGRLVAGISGPERSVARGPSRPEKWGNAQHRRQSSFSGTCGRTPRRLSCDRWQTDMEFDTGSALLRRL